MATATVEIKIAGTQLMVDIHWSEAVPADEASDLYQKIEDAIMGVVGTPPAR